MGALKMVKQQYQMNEWWVDAEIEWLFYFFGSYDEFFPLNLPFSVN